MQPVVSYAIVEMDKYRVATVPVATQSSRSSRSSRTSSLKVSSWSIEARLKEKERQIKRTEFKAQQAMEEARIRQEEEDRIRRLDEEKKREKVRVEAEKVQRQLKKELESHQLSSRILQQQLKFEQRSPRSVTPVEASSNLFFQPEVKAAATPVSSVQQQLEVSSVPAKGALAKIKKLFSTFTPARTSSSHGPAEESRLSKNSSRSLKAPWSDSKNVWMNKHLDDERAAQQTAKLTQPASLDVPTTDLNPRAGEFEPARAGSTPLLGSSVSVTQPKTFGDQPPEEGGVLLWSGSCPVEANSRRRTLSRCQRRILS
jgi:enabled protein